MRNRLKVIRAEQNLTQQQLADLSGLTRAGLALIEGNVKSPSGETIAKLVKATGVPANKIFYDLDV